MQRDEAGRSRDAVDQITPARARPVLILLVEDNLISQKVTLFQLRKLGYGAEAVSDGSSAIEAAATGRFALILMDCQMPEVDGYAATAAIRAAEAGRQDERRIPIIALTANIRAAEREACFAAGMDDFLAKPVNPSVLGATLVEWLKDRDASEPQPTDQS